MHGYNAAKWGRAVCVLPEPADFAGPVLSLCSILRWNAHGEEPLRVATVRTRGVLTVRLGETIQVPVRFGVWPNEGDLHVALGLDTITVV